MYIYFEDAEIQKKNSMRYLTEREKWKFKMENCVADTKEKVKRELIEIEKASKIKESKTEDTNCIRRVEWV